MVFSLLVFSVALIIAAVAAWFSVAGLMAIFAASALPVALMAGSLEIGKLVAASWVYRNWRKAPFLLKSYLTFAVVVLMFITSMGIFGFLSRAHLEQASEGLQSQARIERIENDIIRYEDTIKRSEIKISKLETQNTNNTDEIQSQIDAEQNRMDQAYARVQPAIDEQLDIISNEQNGTDNQVKSYLVQIANIDTTLDNLQSFVVNDEIKKLQALVGVKTDGNYGPQTAKKVDQFRISQQAEKKKLVNIVENIRTSIDTSIVEQARVEIKRLRTIADRDVQKSQTTITRLRSQLDRVAEIDNTTKILELRNIVQETETNISTSLDNKFQLETEVRVLEAEVGPIKYIAELVYGNTERNTIDDAVRWLIIVFIFVFDPLAVLLLIAANYSFKNRNDNDSSQEEIFDALFAKKDKKKLDIASNIDDTGVEETKEDITRKLNTSLVKRHGWLDKK
ncbi:hypothetical protein N9E09_00455 [bacterium]|jgi:hypothetical protein|nr:hypothetical protein [bacterium]